MSDFQDHLKHQYAYVARGEFKPGQFAVARELFVSRQTNHERRNK